MLDQPTGPAQPGNRYPPFFDGGEPLGYYGGGRRGLVDTTTDKHLQ